MFEKIEKGYNRWISKLKDNKILSNQLIDMKKDRFKIIDCFGSCLKFGTAGARGIIGVGTNRMNSVTVSHISSSYAEYLNNVFRNPSLVVSYDTRKYSREFAQCASEVFAANGIKVYFFNDPSPIGILSFSIRELKCSGGVMITASHNSPEYNGYKIYNSHGAQPVDVGGISSILKNKDIFDFKRIDFSKAISSKKIEIIKDDIEDKYISKIKKFLKFDPVKNVNITYSPLNGCSSKIFLKLFDNCQVNVVSEQNCLDTSFSTCNPPDPQKEKSFLLSFDVAKKNNSDLIILNDPDGDRLGISIKFNNSYKILTALEIASLFLNFIIECENKKNICIIKSIVSGGLCDKIVDFYKIKCIQTLPGFKYISKEIEKMEQNNYIKLFALGFEESNGFLLLPDVRDKDGISSSAFFCKMVSYYKERKLNCIDVLNNLYKRFGYVKQKSVSFKESNSDIISGTIDRFKKYFNVNSSDVSIINDYRNSETFDVNLKKLSYGKIEKSDILEIIFCDGNKLFVRPSGTEPLIKFYILYGGKTEYDAINKCNNIENLILKIYKNY